MRGPFNYRFGLASPFYDNETGLSPADLFAVAGSRGFFYDFSDYSTQFTDTAGTTAITGVGQSLARVNDKSGLGNNATQATAGSRALTQVRPMFTQRNRAVGSELVENATYWPASVVNNGLTATKVASGIDTDGLPYVDVRYTGTATDTFHGAAYADQFSRTPAIVGQSWTASLTARVLSGSLTNVNGIDARTVEETAPFTFVGQTVGNQVTASVDTRSVSTRVIASGNQVRLAVVLNVINGATIDITYRIKGLQLELGSTRTTYQPAVSGERRNLLTFTEQFDNAAWIKLNILAFGSGSTANSAVAPDGTNTADLIVPDTSSNQHGVYFSAAAVAGTRYTHSFYAKAAGYDWFYMTEGNNVSASASFNLATGTVGTVAGTGSPVATITSVGNGWYRCTLSLTPISTVQNVQARAANANGGPTFAGNGTSGVLIWGAQLEQASTYSSYQQVVTANEWYEPGFTSYRGIQFDGVDDFLQTAAIDFSNSDKMTVVAGVRKLSDAARAVLVELGAPAAAGSFRIEAPGSSLNNYAMASGGSTIVGTTAAGFSSPISSVLSGLGDISGDNVALRHNGTQVASSPSDQGTGNFANDIVYIGRRAGSSLPFNGIITFLCVINRTLTAAELAQLENYANLRTGAY